MIFIQVLRGSIVRMVVLRSGNEAQGITKAASRNQGSIWESFY